MSHLGILVVSALTVACALPSVASAADYCVGLNTSCLPANHRAKFEEALAAAAMTSAPDRILLGAETYLAPTTAGFAYSSPVSPVEIVGAGAGKSVLTGPAGSGTILDLSGGAGSVVSDLTIRLSSDADGLNTDGAARRVYVDEAAGVTGHRTGVYLNDGATLEDSRVTMTSGGATTGVFAVDGHVRRSTVTAETGIKINNGSIERSRATGFTGVDAYGGETTIVSSRIVGGESYGIHVGSYAQVDRTIVHADGVTILGGDAGTGVFATTELDTGWSAEIDLTNSVIRGFPSSLGASATGTGEAKIVASYSDYAPQGVGAASGAHASIGAANVSNFGDAGFANAAAGDYRLLPGSPLIDAGNPATAQGLDLDGAPLVTDGNGDGTARRDIGAFEAPAVPVAPSAPPARDTQPPLITGFRARSHHGTRFRYTLSEAAKVSIRIQRRLPGRRARYRTLVTLTRNGKAGVNATRLAGRRGRRALRPGRYRARIRATDSAGNRSAPRTTRLRIVR